MAFVKPGVYIKEVDISDVYFGSYTLWGFIYDCKAVAVYETALGGQRFGWSFKKARCRSSFGRILFSMR